MTLVEAKRPEHHPGQLLRLHVLVLLRQALRVVVPDLPGASARVGEPRGQALRVPHPAGAQRAREVRVGARVAIAARVARDERAGDRGPVVAIVGNAEHHLARCREREIADRRVFERALQVLVPVGCAGEGGIGPGLGAAPPVKVVAHDQEVVDEGREAPDVVARPGGCPSVDIHGELPAWNGRTERRGQLGHEGHEVCGLGGQHRLEVDVEPIAAGLRDQSDEVLDAGRAASRVMQHPGQVSGLKGGEQRPASMLVRNLDDGRASIRAQPGVRSLDVTEVPDFRIEIDDVRQHAPSERVRVGLDPVGKEPEDALRSNGRPHRGSPRAHLVDHVRLPGMLACGLVVRAEREGREQGQGGEQEHQVRRVWTPRSDGSPTVYAQLPPAVSDNVGK